MSERRISILATGAHPDDIEYGCGGMLTRCGREGYDIYLMVLTDGGAGGDVAVRRREQEMAAELLHAKELFWGGFKDTEIPVNGRTISLIDKLVLQVKPDEVYVNYFDDTHQDHRVLAQCVISATRHIRKVLFYEGYTTMNFEPDVFVDIEDVLDDKIRLLGAHHSQISKYYPTGLDIIESARAVANFRGFQGKVKCAEGFKALRFLRDV
jgi:LmbE family N-acetylglucosaminyl deacetylase